MIDERVMRLTPKRIKCPFCGEYHEWEGSKLNAYDSSDNPYRYFCNETDVEIYYENGKLHIEVNNNCSVFYNKSISICAELSEIECDLNKPEIVLPFSLVASEIISSNQCDECDNCYFRDNCELIRIGDRKAVDVAEYDYKFDLEFRIEFTSRYFDQYVINGRQKKLESLRAKETEAETGKQANKEEKAMGKEKMSLRRMLYEKSPKENLEKVMKLGEKYKPTLQWAIPVVAVYGAYKILNSKSFDLSVNNVAEVCQERLGLRLAFLEDKKALKELMAIGGISSGVYGTIRLASTLFTPKEEKDITVEDVESGLNKVEELHKKFPYIQPKFENLLPVALSVLLVYVSLHKPKFEGKMAQKVKDLTEDFRVKIETYLELFKLFVEDKFKMDLSSEEEQRKVKLVFAITAMLGIGVFLYGKKILVKTNEEDTDKEAENEKMNEFVKQARAIVEKIAPTLYTTLITFLVSKKILELGEKGEVENIKDVGFIPVDDEAEDSDNAEGAGISDEEGAPTEV